MKKTNPSQVPPPPPPSTLSVPVEPSNRRVARAKAAKTAPRQSKRQPGRSTLTTAGISPSLADRRPPPPPPPPPGREPVLSLSLPPRSRVDAMGSGERRTCAECGRTGGAR
ncbi:hypothetical protein GUJ93_ZPchr0010g9685 [Zizania palustris]|uniref:Uncharacterized protein n=1 Tax=Zizania palustris TaxID=103762 RepID=A0A8J6BEX8_ZIZPA|nr:hypothetical protein GUJ93_ZPchr0010g9685 [Zizania palustris]